MRRLTPILAVPILLACTTSPSASPTPPGPSVPAASASPAVGEPTPGTALTACELVTPADVEAALGLEPGTVSEGTLFEQPTPLDPGVTQCKYNDDSWGGVVVIVTPTDGVNAWDAIAATVQTPAESWDIGDAALWFRDSNLGYFLKGQVLIAIQFNYPVSGAELREAAIALGETAVGKI